MKILISGAGIAGPCLAYWLARHGFTPTLVERAPQLRKGGYLVDFWGAGFDVAERMGLAGKLVELGYRMQELRQVDRDGKRISGFSVDIFDRMTGGRFTSIARGDLAASIYDALGGRVETIFDDNIVAIDPRADGVEVRFERGAARTFDLVIGADGLHSQVRRLAFGEDAEVEQFLGLKVAAFAVDGYRPRDELVYVVHTEVGQQIGRFAMRDDRTMFLFIFTDPTPEVPTDGAGQRALLRERFAASGWECPAILEALDGAHGVYVDRVSQIHLDRWSKGRVALVGDAAFCVSLLGGQGSALAMVAAYVLAGELKAAEGRHEIAFARYEERLHAMIARKQKAALRFAPFFAPGSRAGMFMRNQMMKLMGIPFVAELAVGRELRDEPELPQY
jgi:2-polyprenyl-6-methoxyphenol hydroxylase-like FAD-dependent oxidoreductase